MLADGRISQILYSSMSLSLGLAGVAGVTLWLGSKRFSPGLKWAVACASFSVSFALLLRGQTSWRPGTIYFVAWAGALEAVFWAAAWGMAHGRMHLAEADRTALLEVCPVAAWASGLASCVAMVVLLAMRMTWWALNYAAERPPGPELAAFHVQGLAVFALLLAAVGLAMRRASGAGWDVVAFGLLAAAILWCATPLPRWASDAAGLAAHQVDRSGRIHIAVRGLAVLVAASGVARLFQDDRDRWAWVSRRGVQPAPGPMLRNGLGLGCGAVGLLILILLMVELVQPVQHFESRANGMRVLTSLFILAAGMGEMLWCFRRWSTGMAEIGLALVSLGIVLLFAGLAGAVPDAPAAGYYARLFNAMVGGLALSAVLLAWLTNVWKQQLDEDVPWTTTGRMIPTAKRVVFFNLCFALLLAYLMALWPSLPGIVLSDDSLLRVLGGVASHLALLLAALYGARVTRRPTVAMMPWLTIGSLAMFIAVRVMPYTGRF